jgi:hypothetical protein
MKASKLSDAQKAFILKQGAECAPDMVAELVSLQTLTLVGL